MRWFLTFILLLCFSISSVFSLTQNEQNLIFSQFVQDAMEKYPEWLRENNLDPSPIGQWEDDLSIESINYKLSCKIRDERVHGIANLLNQFNIKEVYARLSTRMFNIHFETRGNITFEGSYNANGTTEREKTINGNGSWSYTSVLGIDEFTEYSLDVTIDGYVNISAGPFHHFVYPISNNNDSIYFEKLWDGEDVDELGWLIEENLLSKYRLKLLDWRTKKPTRVLVHQYLTAVFMATKLDDILGTEDPLPNSCLSTYTLKYGVFELCIFLLYLLTVNVFS